jgi:hypothetical protein
MKFNVDESYRNSQHIPFFIKIMQQWLTLHKKNNMYVCIYLKYNLLNIYQSNTCFEQKL